MKAITDLFGLISRTIGLVSSWIGIIEDITTDISTSIQQSRDLNIIEHNKTKASALADVKPAADLG